MMRKVTLLTLAGLLLAAPSFASAPASGNCGRPPQSLAGATTNEAIFAKDACDPYSLAVMAYIWGKPFVDSAKIRVFFTKPDDPLASRPPSVAGAALNRFGHGRVLADPVNKSGVGPNNDTLYSNATFDLQSGPFVVTTPNFGDRYYTFSVAHPDSSTSASYGSRTHGPKLPQLFLHAADYQGPIPVGMIEISSGDRYLHLWGRTLIRSADDLPKVHALQDAITVQRYRADGTLEPVGDPPVQRQWPAGNDGRAFLRQLAVAIADMDLSPQDHAMALRLAPLLKAAQADQWPAEIRGRAIEQGMIDGEEIATHAAQGFGILTGGWSVNLSGPRFGTDWLLRAAIAKDQIFVTVPEEAIYPIARTSADGVPLDGHSRYRIHFDAPPPVRYFWSITLYDDSGTMVANPVDRYSVGNRTPELARADGTLRDIVISSGRPRDAGALWLPAPESKFYLMMRLYGPDDSIQTGQWLPPAIVKQPTS
ncbi:DUF1214 domain-containing protein [Novosphingobium sp. 2580]|uniref:DUF1214 domain-containing protein n=2 Tax=Novosphingobium album (ex Hu et al. 2023) TaxID=2930093 RepID=A0ABT0B3J3_9SPHN|nr:DUF1214 domain-containing protein [Novosphingobium album (ex Hu et al. 2023)]